MKNIYVVTRRKFLLALAILILIALTTSQSIAPAAAQSGGGYFASVRLASPNDPGSLMPADAYDLTWNSIDDGGGMNSTGGNYSLAGAIGQPDAGTMTGGAYTLTGGFWVDFLGNRVMLPLIVR